MINIDEQLITYEMCNDKTHLDFTNKIMVLKPFRLKEEFRKPEEQLILCTGGFGCAPNKIGNKIYGQFLVDGLECIYRREDFIGELKDEFVPEWAREKREIILEEMLKQDTQDLKMT